MRNHIANLDTQQTETLEEDAKSGPFKPFRSSHKGGFDILPKYINKKSIAVIRYILILACGQDSYLRCLLLEGGYFILYKEKKICKPNNSHPLHFAFGTEILRTYTVARSFL